MPKLTAAFIQNAKPDPSKRLEIPDTIVVGLYAIIQPSGRKSWGCRYRHAGRTRKLTLGSYPAVSVAVARELAREALEEVARGIDPAAAKAARGKAKTFAAVAELFVDKYAKAHQSSWRNTDQQLRKHAFAAWGDREFASITRADVNELIWRVAEGGAPSASNHLLQHLRRLWRWAMDEQLVETSPVERVRKKAPDVARDRVLSDDEIRIVWSAWEQQGWPAGHLQMLLLATGARRGEVAGMSWSELDLDAKLWTIPASRTKSGHVHIVPLSATALEIINQLPRFASGDFLFPAYPRRRASSPAATRAWASRPMGGFGSVKARTDELIKAAGHEMQPWRLHDLRRTCRTNLSRLRVSNDVAEAVIGHVVPGVMGVYDRYDRLPEKAVALEAWANLLREILDPSRKVVALRR